MLLSFVCTSKVNRNAVFKIARHGKVKIIILKQSIRCFNRKWRSRYNAVRVKKTKIFIDYE